jgi:hypothetical protein
VRRKGVLALFLVLDCKDNQPFSLQFLVK